VSVQGLSVEQAQEAIRDAYIKSPEAKPILQPGRERVLVSLMRRRVEQILVFRQDAGGSVAAPTGTGGAATRSFGVTFGPGGAAAGIRRSAAFAVDLPAYENDVLHALAETGGLPGLDAINEVVIQRGYFKEGLEREFLLRDQDALTQGGGARVVSRRRSVSLTRSVRHVY